MTSARALAGVLAALTLGVVGVPSWVASTRPSEHERAVAQLAQAQRDVAAADFCSTRAVAHLTNPALIVPRSCRP